MEEELQGVYNQVQARKSSSAAAARKKLLTRYSVRCPGLADCGHHWLTQRIKWRLVQVEQLLPSEILMRARNELLDKNMTGVSTALLLMLSEKHEGTVLLLPERSATRAYTRCSDRPGLGKGDPDGLPGLEVRGKGHLATHSYDGRSLLHGHPEWQAILPLHA